MSLPTLIIDVSFPEASLRGAAIASLDLPCELVLVGDEAVVRQRLSHLPHDAERIRILHAPERVSVEVCPEKAVDLAPYSPPVVGMKQLATSHAVAMITAGSSDVAVAAAERWLHRLPNVRCGALAAVIPTLRHRGQRQDPFALLLDVGANRSPRAEDYLVNAMMGAAYATVVSANAIPTVALLSNASNVTALPDVVRHAHEMLNSQTGRGWTYRGLIRADHLLHGEADVVLTDGYTGDIVIRTMEGLAASGEAILANATRRFRWRMGVSMLGGGLQRLRELGNWENYGGAPLLGYTKPVMFTQANASERAIVGAIRLALKLERETVVERIRHTVGGQ